jgi:hypothetical protein
MNVYSVMLTGGDSLEVEAECYQSEGQDLIFLVGSEVVARRPSAEVLSVTKSPLRMRNDEPAVPDVWL